MAPGTILPRLHGFPTSTVGQRWAFLKFTRLASVFFVLKSTFSLAKGHNIQHQKEHFPPRFSRFGLFILRELITCHPVTPRKPLPSSKRTDGTWLKVMRGGQPNRGNGRCFFFRARQPSSQALRLVNLWVSWVCNDFPGVFFRQSPWNMIHAVAVTTTNRKDRKIQKRTPKKMMLWAHLLWVLTHKIHVYLPTFTIKIN